METCQTTACNMGTSARPTLRVKVCGMRDVENIRQVEALGIDMMGFIFYPKSSRFVASRPAYLPSQCQRVGVFVNADSDFVCRHVEEYALDFVQLHGNETPAFCEELRGEMPANVGIIKSLPISYAEDFTATEAYAPIVDFFLFETKCTGYGGSGQQFDWDVLQGYAGQVPFLLAGGISFEDAERINGLAHPRLAGVDLNSRFELAPGLKDVSLLRRFLQSLNS